MLFPYDVGLEGNMARGMVQTEKQQVEGAEGGNPGVVACLGVPRRYCGAKAGLRAETERP